MERPTAEWLAQGHLFSATPVGNPLWSGGTDGPEGSLLVLGAILFLLLVLLGFYRRGNSAASDAPAAAQQLD